MLDQTKLLLFVALMLLIVMLVTNQKRPLASAPIDGTTPLDASPIEQSNISPTWAANVPNMTMPLALMVPNTGAQPVGGT